MKIGVLISGRGSNMNALLRACRSGRIPGSVVTVISNRSDARGIDLATEQGIPALAIAHKDYSDRDSHEKAVIDELKARGVELVCLAGYMRLLGAGFIAAFPNRILNIHPSLLPAYPGLNAQRQAWEGGARVSGATVHFVDEELDHGAIVAQEAVPVLPGDTPDTLAARILEAEHRLYPEAVAAVAGGRTEIDGQRVLCRL